MSTVYRTYYTGEFDKNKIRAEIIPNTFSSFIAKPLGGLWGCRGNEWYKWCKYNNFRTYEADRYFEWKLKDTAKLFYIDTEKDIEKFFSYKKDMPEIKRLLEIPEIAELHKYNIDWKKLRKDFDAVEISPNIAYNYRYMDNNLIGFSAWDVPSIVVLKDGVIDLIGDNACLKNVCF